MTTGEHEITPALERAGAEQAPPRTEASGESTVPAAPMTALGAQASAIFRRPGMVTVGLMAAVTFGIGLLSAALLMIAITRETQYPFDAGTVFVAILSATGSVLGSGVVGAVEGAQVFGQSIEVGAGATLLFLGTLAAVAAGVFLVVRRRRDSDHTSAAPVRSLLARAAIEAGIVAAVITLITAIPSIQLPIPYVGQVVVRSNGIGTFAVLFVLLLAVLVAARSDSPLARMTATATSGAVASALRELAVAASVFGLLFGAVALLGTLISSTAQGQPLWGLAALTVLGNITVFAASLAGFGGLAAHIPGSSPVLIMAWDIGDGWGSLLFLIGAVALAISAIRIGVRRGPTQGVRWHRVWQLPVVSLPLWIVLALVTGVTATGGTSFGGASVSLGMAWWAPLLATLFTIAASVLAEVAPTYVATFSPRLFPYLAGKGSATWATRSASVAAPLAPMEAPDASGASASDARPLALASTPGRAPLSPKAKKRAAIIGSGVLGIALLIGAAAATVAIFNAMRGPAAAVETYLDRLAAGDASGAAELVDPGVPNDERMLLSDEALASADHLIEVGDVRAFGAQDETASVEATLSIDGERFTHMFTVARGTPDFLVLDTWEVKNALIVPFTARSQHSDEVFIGDLALPSSAQNGEPAGALWVYPGTYTVTGPESAYISSTPETVRVIPGADASVIVEQSPTDLLADTVLAKVHERMTACVTVPTNLDEACPSVLRSADLASMTLVSQPDGLDQLTLTEFVSEQATISTLKNATTYWTPTAQESTFRLRGEIVFEDGEPVVSFTKSSRW